MTILNAFAESRNIPALKLAARVGIDKVIDWLTASASPPKYHPICPSRWARSASRWNSR